MQYSQQRKKPRGRRFTIDEKTFCLALLKQSPKQYKFLRRFMTLPSKRTLMRIMANIPITAGENESILIALKETAKKMDPLDRLCYLTFDEIALSNRLNHNIKDDIGFQNNDVLRKPPHGATHATVFMVCGIRQTWKQPLCFYFSGGSMPASELVMKVKSNIRALKEVGFTVLATVCDQDSTNTSCIKYLLNESEQVCQDLDDTSKYAGFTVDGDEVIPIFNVPNLLKCVRNNFIVQDIKFTYNGKECIASWKHIIAAYEIDKGDYDTSILHKLTDSHVHIDKLEKKEVSVAAQVLSHRVASTVRLLSKGKLEFSQFS